MLVQKKYFDILQIYRGIASLAVVIHHTYASFAHYHHLDISVLHFLATLGKLGVDFFFVLSGFIIAYTTYNYRDKISYLKKYIFNRIIRIFIPYLPVSLVMLLLYFFMPTVSNSERSVSVITSIFLIPHGNPALSVGWTLVFEMFFYLIYSLNFFSKKVWYVALAFWISGILLMPVLDIKLNNVVFSLVFNWYNLEFILGVFVAYLLKNNYFSSPSKWIILIPVILFLLFIYCKINAVSYFPFSQNLLFAISAAGFLLMGIQHFRRKIPDTNLFMRLGNSSFSLYLLHNLLQSILVRLMPKSQSQSIVFMEFMIVIAICCAVSYIYYLIFEKYCIAELKKKFARYDS